MTDPELVALAAELAQRVALLAELLEHPRINAASIELHRAEALAAHEALGAGLLDMAGQGLFHV